MPEQRRSPESEQPLARPVGEQRLARPVGAEQEEATQVEEELQEAPQSEEEQQEASQIAREQKEKGLIHRAIDKAQEKGLVGESTASRVREHDLVARADEAIDKAKNRLSGR
jgi:flagellar biosynthesis GTPase FlhF